LQAGLQAIDRQLNARQTEVDSHLQKFELEKVEAEKNLADLHGQIDIAEAAEQQVRGTIVELDNTIATIRADINTATRELSTTREMAGREQEELEAITAKTVAKQQEYDHIEAAIRDAEQQLSTVKQQAIAAEAALSDLNADHRTRLDNHENELRAILKRTGEAARRLQDIERQEHTIKSQITTERMALQKEREGVERMQAQVADAETKVAKYKRYMQL
jgi:chromosome segregation ATPase